MLRFIILVLLLVGLLNLVTADLLECRMIESVCKEESSCLDKMQINFPQCYQPVPIDKRFWDNDFGTNKRALRLLNILRKVDKIPAGR